MFKLTIKIFLIFFLITPLINQAQTSKTLASKSVKYKANVDAPLTNSELNKIREVFQESTQGIVLDNPQYLKRTKHLLRNRIRILKIDIKAKQKTHLLLSQVELFNHYNKDLKRDKVFDKTTFNALKYNFNFFPSKNLLYRVDGTNYYIQIKSQFQ